MWITWKNAWQILAIMVSVIATVWLVFACDSALTRQVERGASGIGYLAEFLGVVTTCS